MTNTFYNAEGEEIELQCARCGKTPSEDMTYKMFAREQGITPEQYVLENEGTLNVMNGHYLCDDCYIAAGQPSSPTGWKTP